VVKKKTKQVEISKGEREFLEAKVAFMDRAAKREKDGISPTPAERRDELPFHPLIQYALKTTLFTERDFYEQRRVPWKVAKKIRWEDVVKFSIEPVTGYNAPRDLGKMTIAVSGGMQGMMNKYSRLRCGIDMDEFPEFDDKLFVPMNIYNTFLAMLMQRPEDFQAAICSAFKVKDPDPIILKTMHFPVFSMKRYCMARPEPVPIYTVTSYDLREMLYDAIVRKGRKGDYVEKDTGEYDGVLMKKLLPELRSEFFDMPVSVMAKAFERIGPFRLITDSGLTYFVRKEVMGSGFGMDNAKEAPLSAESVNDFRFTKGWAVTMISDGIPEFSLRIDMPTHFTGTVRELWHLYGKLNSVPSKLTDVQGNKEMLLGITPEMVHLLKIMVFISNIIPDDEKGEVVSKYDTEKDKGSVLDFLSKCNCSRHVTTVGKPMDHPLLKPLIDAERPRWYSKTPGDTKFAVVRYDEYVTPATEGDA
jgi:hypothetical protein